MDYPANYKFDLHHDLFECPGKIMMFNEKDNDYGKIIHDGCSSTIDIHFCT